MYCLYCHKKIPRLRAWRTGAKFCSEEHASAYKQRTMERLIGSEDEAEGSAEPEQADVAPIPPPVPAPGLDKSPGAEVEAGAAAHQTEPRLQAATDAGGSRQGALGEGESSETDIRDLLDRRDPARSAAEPPGGESQDNPEENEEGFQAQSRLKRRTLPSDKQSAQESAAEEALESLRRFVRASGSARYPVDDEGNRVIELPGPGTAEPIEESGLSGPTETLEPPEPNHLYSPGELAETGDAGEAGDESAEVSIWSTEPPGGPTEILPEAGLSDPEDVPEARIESQFRERVRFDEEDSTHISLPGPDLLGDRVPAGDVEATPPHRGEPQGDSEEIAQEDVTEDSSPWAPGPHDAFVGDSPEVLENRPADSGEMGAELSEKPEIDQEAAADDISVLRHERGEEAPGNRETDGASAATPPAMETGEILEDAESSGDATLPVHELPQTPPAGGEAAAREAVAESTVETQGGGVPPRAVERQIPSALERLLEQPMSAPQPPAEAVADRPSMPAFEPALPGNAPTGPTASAPGTFESGPDSKVGEGVGESVEPPLSQLPPSPLTVTELARLTARLALPDFGDEEREGVAQDTLPGQPLAPAPVAEQLGVEAAQTEAEALSPEASVEPELPLPLASSPWAGETVKKRASDPTDGQADPVMSPLDLPPRPQEPIAEEIQVLGPTEDILSPVLEYHPMERETALPSELDSLGERFSPPLYPVPFEFVPEWTSAGEPALAESVTEPAPADPADSEPAFTPLPEFFSLPPREEPLGDVVEWLGPGVFACIADEDVDESTWGAAAQSRSRGGDTRAVRLGDPRLPGMEALPERNPIGPLLEPVCPANPDPSEYV